MSKYTCQGCGRSMDNGYICSQCDKILCSSCRPYGSCKDSPKGKSGCNGSYRELK